VSNLSTCGPTASCPWVRVQEVLYPLCGCSSSPHSQSYTQHNTTSSHSLSLLPRRHHLHCPWSQDLDPSTAREPLYELQGPTPFDSQSLEPLSSNLGQE
jgi:hypothetical protein